MKAGILKSLLGLLVILLLSAFLVSAAPRPAHAASWFSDVFSGIGNFFEDIFTLDEGTGSPSMSFLASVDRVNFLRAITVKPGEEFLLKWERAPTGQLCTGTTDANPQGSWPGGKNSPSGEEPVNAPATDQIAKYFIKCGEAKADVTVTVAVGSGGGGGGNAPPKITYFTGNTVAANNNNTALQLTAGQALTLRWKTTNTTSCSASGAWGPGQAATGNPNEAGQAFNAFPVQSPPYIFTLTCQNNASQSTTNSVYVRVSQAPPPPAPTVTLTANPATITTGQSTTLTWSSTNTTSCSSATPAGWPGSTATSGTKLLSPTTTTTYSITCSGTRGSASKTATVTVNPPSVTVTCAAAPTNPQVRQEVTWTATVTNPPAGTLTYVWSGTDISTLITTTTPTNFIKKTYTSSGTKTATVTVAGATANCPAVTVAAATIGGVTISGKVIYNYVKFGLTLSANQGTPVGLYLGDTKLEEVVTDKSGKFTFTKHPTGQTYTLKIVLEGFELSQQDELVSLSQYDQNRSIILNLRPKAQSGVHGLVVFVKDQQGVAMAGVDTLVKAKTKPLGTTKYNDGQTDQTGGAFMVPLIGRDFEIQFPTDITLTVSAPGYVTQIIHPINLSTTESITSVIITLQSKVAGAKTTYIKFQQKGSSRSVKDVYFTIKSSATGKQAYLTPDGNFIIALPPSTTYTLSAKSSGYTDRTVQFQAGDKVVVEMTPLIYSCDNVTVNGTSIRFCFKGIIANQSVKPNLQLLQAIAARIIQMNSHIKLQLTQPYPAQVIITDDNRVFDDPTMPFFDGIWSNPNLLLNSKIINDQIDPISRFLSVVSHEMGHAYYDALPREDRKKFIGFYEDEKKNPKVFDYENENFYDQNFFGHPQDFATEAFASMTSNITHSHAALHRFIDTHDRNKPELEVIKQLIKQKHDFLHETVGI